MPRPVRRRVDRGPAVGHDRHRGGVPFRQSVEQGAAGRTDRRPSVRERALELRSSRTDPARDDRSLENSAGRWRAAGRDELAAARALPAIQSRAGDVFGGPRDDDEVSADRRRRGLTMSMTVWNRLEPRPRARAIDETLKVCVHDPLWMIARQWQMGELAGEDAASPAFVSVTASSAVID